jgi:TolB-like protein/Flp pilus assembly protein TadD
VDRPFTAYDGNEPYVFVSYSHKNSSAVFPELVWLNEIGFNVWYDEGIEAGTEWREELAKAIEEARLLVYFITAESVQSQNCRKEVSFAVDQDIPIIAIHIEKTDLPSGLNLTLSDRQAILKYELPKREYQQKLQVRISSYLNHAILQPFVAKPKKTIPVIVGIAVALVLVMGLFFYNQQKGQSPTAKETDAVSTSVSEETVLNRKADLTVKRSIAVLPFSNLSNDQEQEFFSDGIAEDILNGLARNPQLKVIARTSSFVFRGKNIDVREIASKLGVAYVLEGSVRQEGNHVRVTASLINTEDGTQVWSDRFDGEMTDIFVVQDEISDAILSALDIELVISDPSLTVASNGPAYEAYLNGRLWARKTSGQGWPRAIEYYKDAVRLGPKIALAHAALADAYANYSIWGGEDARITYPKAKEAADEAIRLNPHLAEAHAAQALVKLFFEWNWEEAEVAFRQAIRLNPNDSQVLHHFGHYLDFRGNHQESLRAFGDALALDPVSAFQWTGRALTLTNMNEFERARVALDRAFKLPPTSPQSWFVLGSLHDARGEIEKAVSAWEHAKSLDSSLYFVATLGYGYARAGRVEEAKALLEHLESNAQPGIGAMHRAKILAGLGDFDRTFQLLEEALATREPWIIGLKIDRGFEPVKNDPRFTAVLARIGVKN